MQPEEMGSNDRQARCHGYTSVTFAGHDAQRFFTDLFKLF